MYMTTCCISASFPFLFFGSFLELHIYYCSIQVFVWNESLTATITVLRNLYANISSFYELNQKCKHFYRILPLFKKSSSVILMFCSGLNVSRLTSKKDCQWVVNWLVSRCERLHRDLYISHEHMFRYASNHCGSHCCGCVRHIGLGNTDEW